LRRIPPFRTLDALRGFAAAWVVMDHSCASFLGSGNSQYAHEPLYAFSIRGQLGVMFFFIISGYCITAAAYGALIGNKPLWRYAYERVRRIYPPYLAALLLGVIADLAIAHASSHHWISPVHHLVVFAASPRYWIANLFLLQFELNTGMVNIVFWSLCLEVAFYAVVGALLWMAQRVAARPGRGNAHADSRPRLHHVYRIAVADRLRWRDLSLRPVASVRPRRHSLLPDRVRA
jgi:hypothetical protein